MVTIVFVRFDMVTYDGNGERLANSVDFSKKIRFTPVNVFNRSFTTMTTILLQAVPPVQWLLVGIFPNKNGRILREIALK